MAAGGLPLPLGAVFSNDKVFYLESKFKFDDFGGLPLYPLPAVTLTGASSDSPSLSLPPDPSSAAWSSSSLESSY